MGQLDPAYVTIPFIQMLENCHNNVLLGLRLVEKIEELPGPTDEELQFMQLTLGRSGGSDISRTKELFKRWLLMNGFEDIHSCLRATLERLLVFKAIENRLSDDPSLDIKGVEPNLRTMANKLNYPLLFEGVHKELRGTLAYEEQLKSINCARNCLVHRNGLVTTKDCNNDQNDKLIIAGTRFMTFFKKGDEEVPAKVGQLGPENAALMLGAEEFRIEFSIGTKLDITLKQFIDILYTCIFFRADVDEKLKDKKT